MHSSAATITKCSLLVRYRQCSTPLFQIARSDDVYCPFNATIFLLPLLHHRIAGPKQSTYIILRRSKCLASAAAFTTNTRIVRAAILTSDKCARAQMLDTRNS
mmetsp:Transcript_5261/g.14113  ORF Transcript_5261/g.14113 Transcript_5261/m.14113 type:complete len:103 (+) Transcript_5261:1475-1783(+)